MSKLGIVGVGTMGGHVAGHLLNAGLDVIVFDTREEAMERLTESGAAAASSVQEVGASSNLVLLSLPGPDTVAEVVIGQDGLIDILDPGDIVVDLSTTGPATTNDVARRLAEQEIDFLSAPVSGGAKGAREGSLCVMVGGDREVFEGCEHLLHHFGSTIVHVGNEPASGQHMKLVNQYLTISAVVSTSEAFALGQQVGLDLDMMIEVMNESSGKNIATEYHFPEQIATGEYAMGTPFSLLEKDADLYATLADEHEVPLLLGQTIRQLLKYARAEFGESADWTNLHRFFRDTMGSHEPR